MSDELKPCPFCGSESAPHVTDCIETMVCHNIAECDDETLFWVTCSVLRGGCGAEAGYVRTKSEAVSAWNARAERECRFALEEDREALAEKAACGPGEFVTQDMPDLLWTCSACGEQYENGLDALPGWLRHCPNCGAKVVASDE